MKTGLTIGISPLTNRIYIGAGRPDSNHWSGSKTDVTEQAIHCAAEHVLNQYPGKTMILSVGPVNGETTYYEIQVTKTNENPMKG